MSRVRLPHLLQGFRFRFEKHHCATLSCDPKSFAKHALALFLIHMVKHTEKEDRLEQLIRERYIGGVKSLKAVSRQALVSVLGREGRTTTQDEFQAL